MALQRENLQQMKSITKRMWFEEPKIMLVTVLIILANIGNHLEKEGKCFIIFFS